jgi:hypothetical protein
VLAVAPVSSLALNGNETFQGIKELLLSICLFISPKRLLADDPLVAEVTGRIKLRSHHMKV